MRFQASKLERDLVRMALDIANETASEYSALMPAQPCRPVPFFGPLERAEVITLGLNPSTGEFVRKRNWSRVSDEELPDELVNYFGPDERRARHPWFEPWETVLSDLGMSYRLNAAHIDLTPRATNCRKGELKPLFIRMLQTDAPIWVEALRCASKCKLVLAAGSATNDPRRGWINQFISKMLSEPGLRLEGEWRASGGEGQTVFQTLCLDQRRIPLFFCSTGPSSKSKAVLIKACQKEENMDQLKRLVARSIVS
jgi:hypothetical protein